MAKSNDKTQVIYEFIQSFCNENSYPPSVREICSALSIKSTATCQYYIKKLQEQGMITSSDGKKRAIMLTKPKTEAFNVPLLGTIAAGTPVFAYENYDDYIPVPKEFGDENEIFALTAKGESMRDIGIYSGDKVIIKKQETADNGEIIAALVGDGATVKRFFKKDGKIILHPENETMQDIVLDDVCVLGKVVGLIRKY